MEGLTAEEAGGWRESATSFYEQAYFTNPEIEQPIGVLDPCRRKKFHDEPYSENLARRIVAMDTEDIFSSDLILCNLAARGNGKAWGSVMELVIAKQFNVPVITVLEPGFNHPFIRVYSTEIHHTLEDALNTSLGYFQ
jgi:hypothetical protein